MLNIDKDVPGAIYLVKNPKKDTYKLYSRYGAWEGSLRMIWQKMFFEFGVKNSEIRLALQEMDFNDHLASHFGTFGSFMFTQGNYPVK